MPTRFRVWISSYFGCSEGVSKKEIQIVLPLCEGEDFIELPAKVVFTIKPEKYKIRIVACGNQTKDTYGKITTTDLDTCMLRFILSWAASSRFNTIASLDVTAAFLNADLPPGRVVVLQPPTVLYKLGLIPTGFVWRVRRAVYGLREAPSLWSQERTKVMETMTFRSRGEPYKVLVSEIHRSILLLVREHDVLTSPQLTYAGLSQESSTQGCYCSLWDLC